MDNEQQRITSGARELGISLSDERAAELVRYLDILDVTNRSFNLTRIPREEYATLHVLDSLAALTVVSQKPHMRVLDIGTGAGFPGVPIAAALADAHVTLLDSTNKKVRFAADTAYQCGITNCVGIHQRAEALAKDSKHRCRYDLVVSRAVASFSTLAELMAPFIAPGGRAVALKGAKAHDEIAGADKLVRALGCSNPTVNAVTIPGTQIERYLIVFDKPTRARA